MQHVERENEASPDVDADDDDEPAAALAALERGHDMSMQQAQGASPTEPWLLGAELHHLEESEDEAHRRGSFGNSHAQTRCVCPLLLLGFTNDCAFRFISPPDLGSGRG